MARDGSNRSSLTKTDSTGSSHASSSSSHEAGSQADSVSTAQTEVSIAEASKRHSSTMLRSRQSLPDFQRKAVFGPSSPSNAWVFPLHARSRTQSVPPRPLRSPKSTPSVYSRHSFTAGLDPASTPSLPAASHYDRMWSSPYDIALPLMQQRSNGDMARSASLPVPPIRKTQPSPRPDPPSPVFMSKRSSTHSIAASTTSAGVNQYAGAGSSLGHVLDRYRISLVPVLHPSYTPLAPESTALAPPQIDTSDERLRRSAKRASAPSLNLKRKPSRSDLAQAYSTPPESSPTTPTRSQFGSPSRQKSIHLFWTVDATEKEQQDALDSLRTDEHAVANYHSSPEDPTSRELTEDESPTNMIGRQLPLNLSPRNPRQKISDGSYGDGAPADWDELDENERRQRHAESTNGAPLERRKTRLEKIGAAFNKLGRKSIGEDESASMSSSATRRKLKKRRRQSASTGEASGFSSAMDGPDSPEVASPASPARSRRSSFGFHRSRASSNAAEMPFPVPSSPLQALAPLTPIVANVHPLVAEAHVQPTPPSSPIVRRPVAPSRDTFLPRSFSVPAMPADFARSPPTSWTHEPLSSVASSEHGFSEDDLSPSVSRRASLSNRRWSRELSTFIALEDDMAFQRAVMSLYDDPALNEQPESKRASMASFDTKACFVVRELLASEKSYLKHLTDLNSSIDYTASVPLPRPPVASYMSDTDLPYLASQRVLSSTLEGPPKNEHVDLLRTHLPPVMALADKLIKRWSEDPSPISVALTFLEYEEELRHTYATWILELPRLLSSVREAVIPPALGPASPLSIRGRRNLQYKRNSVTESDTDAENLPLIERRKSWVSSVGARKRKDTFVKASRASGKLTISDIVIMPSQRVTRYELFLKGLLKHTRGEQEVSTLVEQALRGVQDLASFCDSLNAPYACFSDLGHFVV